MQNWLKSTWRDLVLATFVGLMIFIPRSQDLDRYVTIDEPTWLTYAGNFYYALGQRDWANTYQREHPAVTLSWVGTAAFLLEYPEYRGEGQGYFPHAYKKASLYYRAQGHNPLDLIETSRFLMVLVISSTLTLAFWFLKRLVGRWPALLGFILLAFSPFHIAHSQVYHADAFMGTFMFLALSAFLAYLLLGKSKLDLTIAALATGLAWLTKAPSAILLPIFGLILLLYEGRKLLDANERPTINWAWRELVKPLAIIVLLAGLIFVALFPAMWVDPLGSISQMFSKVGFYSESGGTSLRVFFNGNIVTHERPSLFFYPITYLWRSTPVTLIGFLLSGLFLMPMLRQGKKETTSTVAFIWIYLLVFTIWLTLPARMFDRYFHAFFGPAAFIAGVAWYGFFSWIRERSNPLISRYASFSLLFLIVAIQFFSAFNVAPYYLSHYNQLLGGQQKAQNVMMIGWGDGLNLAADYLREQPNPEDMRILTWYGTGSFSYFWFTEETITTLDMTWNQEYSNEYQNADYAIIYVQQIQRGAPKTLLDFLSRHEPEHTISINGLEYMWIYNLRALPEPEFVSQ